MKPNQPTTSPAAAPTASDNLCKRLAELYPEQFAKWLFGARGVTVEKTELSREPIRAELTTETFYVVIDYIGARLAPLRESG